MSINTYTIKNGKVLINRLKWLIRTNWQTLKFTLQPNESKQEVFALPEDSYFQLFKQTCDLLPTQFNSITVEMRDMSNNTFQNKPVLVEHIFGNTASFPFILPTTFSFTKNNGLVVTATNLTSVTQSFNLTFAGRIAYRITAQSLKVALPQAPLVTQVVERPFYYTTGNVVIPAGATNYETDALNILVTSDAYFEVKKVVASATGNFTLKIFDKFADRFLMPAFTMWSNVFGNVHNITLPPVGIAPAGVPFVLPEDTLFEPNTRIMMQVNNLTNPPTAITINITLIGRKIYADGEE